MLLMKQNTQPKVHCKTLFPIFNIFLENTCDVMTVTMGIVGTMGICLVLGKMVTATITTITIFTIVAITTITITQTW